MREGAIPLGLSAAGTLLGPGCRAVHAAWSPDGEYLAASFVDGSIRIWRGLDPAPYRELHAAAGAVEHMAWSPDGSCIASARRGPLLRWEVETCRSLPAIDVGPAAVSALSWSDSGADLCAAVRDSEGDVEKLVLRRYRAEDGALTESVEREQWAGAWLAKSAARNLVALALVSNDVELWDLRHLKLVARFAAEHWKPYGVALSPDRQIVALSYGDGSVWMWKVPEGQVLQVLQIHEAPAYSLDFSFDQSFLASKSLDGTVRIRLCADWRKGSRLEEPSGSFETELAFHPKRLRLATYGALHTELRLWDLDPSTLGLFGGDDMIPIRFFSANPTDVHLKLDEEFREIQDHLAFAKLRDRFDLQIRPAAKPDDLIRFLTGDRPRVVHFSGHGTKTGCIITEDVTGKPFPIGAEALSNLFRLVADHVDCVVLNACYAETQARAIAQHISYVVGMHTTISDGAAIAYSKGFYQSLGNGVSFEKAHEFGVAQIGLSGYNETQIPVLIRRGEAPPADVAPVVAAAQAPAA
jgi:dipeptidyl aminopeptidase/acylaminoacyl peptidase